MLPPLGAHVAASTTCSSSSSGTGSGLRRRIARIVDMTSKTGASAPIATEGAAMRETLSGRAGGAPRVVLRPVELVPDDPPVAEAVQEPQVEVGLELAAPPARVPDQVDEQRIADHLVFAQVHRVLLP